MQALGGLSKAVHDSATSPLSKDGNIRPIRSLMRIAQGPVLSILSQLAGAAQLLLILTRVGAGELTDSFFYLWNIGMLPVLTLIVGTCYPLLINGTSISLPNISRIRLAACILSTIFVVLGAYWMYTNGRSAESVVLSAALMAVLVALQVYVFTRAVLSAAGSNPNWLASVALLPNLLAVVALLLPLGSTVLVYVMIAALIVGNLVTLALMLRFQVGDDALSGIESRTGPQSWSWSSASWFLARSGVSQGGLAVVQSTAVLLPASQLTLSTIVVKLVGSGTMTFANAILPRFLHTNTSSQVDARRLMRFLWLFWGVVGIVACTVCSLFLSRYFVIVLLTSLWLLASSTGLIAQRIAFRFLPPRASWLTIFSVVLVCLVTITASCFDSFNLLFLLAAYALIESLSGFLLLIALRDWVAATLIGAIVCVICVIPMIGGFNF